MRPYESPSERCHVVAFLFGLTMLRIYAALWFDITAQGDTEIQFSYLKAIIELKRFESYNAPYYYLLVALLSAPLTILYRAGLIGDHAFLSGVATWSGIIFLIVCAAGCLTLGRHLGFDAKERMIYAALCCLLPAVHRSVIAIRPENLILALSPWACVFTHVWLKKLGGTVAPWLITVFWPTVVVNSVMAAQKVTGLVLSIGLGALSFFITRGSWLHRAKNLWHMALALAVAFLVLAIAHRGYSGVWLFQHQAYQPGRMNIVAPFSVYISFDPVAVWANPFRDAHKGSIWNILLIDLFGDYWQYGYDYQGAEKWGWRLFRARLGVSAAAAFTFVYAIAVSALLHDLYRFRSDASSAAVRQRAALSGLFLLGMASLIGAGLAGQYHPGKGDIFKWIYIVMFVPFLMLPPVHLLQTIRNRAARWLYSAVLVAFIAVGALQSMWLPSLF